MSATPVPVPPRRTAVDYQPPRLRRLGTLAELTRGGFTGSTAADHRPGAPGPA